MKRNDTWRGRPRRCSRYRGRILEYLASTPAATTTEVYASLGPSARTGIREKVLNDLVSEGHVRRTRRAGVHFYWLDGARPCEEELLRGTRLAVLEHTRQNPETTARRAALELGVAKSTVTYHWHALDRLGLRITTRAPPGDRAIGVTIGECGNRDLNPS